MPQVTLGLPTGARGQGLGRGLLCSWLVQHAGLGGPSLPLCAQGVMTKTLDPCIKVSKGEQVNPAVAKVCSSPVRGRLLPAL